MAKKVESKFLIIEATASEFLNAGFGAGPVTDCGVIAGGVFDGFSMISVAGGERMVCDYCNDEIKAEDACYYVSVLNQVMCRKCFEQWHASAKYYPEDARIEQKNYEYTLKKLEAAGSQFIVPACSSQQV